MNNYDLAKLIDDNKDIPLPKIIERLSSQRQYQKALRKILKQTGDEVRNSLLVLYAQSLQDDSDIETTALMIAVVWTLSRATSNAILTAEALITAEASYLDRQFISAVKRATKADISALVRPDDVSDMVKKIVERNTSLITSLSDETREKIQQAVVDAQINKHSQAQLKQNIKGILGKQANRADLIATDQMEKLSAELTAVRAKQAGLNWYIWRTQADGRVRKKHSDLAGKEQDANNPSHGDDGQLPRQPIRCRCWAQWIIKQD